MSYTCSGSRICGELGDTVEQTRRTPVRSGRTPGWADRTARIRRRGFDKVGASRRQTSAETFNSLEAGEATAWTVRADRPPAARPAAASGPDGSEARARGPADAGGWAGQPLGSSKNARICVSPKPTLRAGARLGTSGATCDQFSSRFGSPALSQRATSGEGQGGRVHSVSSSAPSLEATTRSGAIPFSTQASRPVIAVKRSAPGPPAWWPTPGTRNSRRKSRVAASASSDSPRTPWWRPLLRSAGPPARRAPPDGSGSPASRRSFGSPRLTARHPHREAFPKNPSDTLFSTCRRRSRIPVHVHRESPLCWSEGFRAPPTCSGESRVNDLVSTHG